jgi:hypothetical protein
MATLTFSWFMLTSERKFSFVVIEDILLPILGIVAILTFWTELAFVHIVLFVARIAI